VAGAEAALQAPLEAEWANLQTDWRTATEYVRRQWRSPQGPAGSRHPAADDDRA
jgi:hypothetical protein